MERSYSWSKPDIDKVIGEKCVDLSLIENGETGIPAAFQQYFDAANKQSILRGTKKKINLIYFGLKYSAFIKNVARKDSKSCSYKITSISKEFKEILKKEFAASYNYLKSDYKRKTSDYNKKIHIKLPEELAEYIVFYKTETPFEYHVEFVLRETTKVEEDIILIKDGKSNEVLTNQYERNIQNRLRAIEIHGCVCAVCGFDFEQAYGDLGKGYIEIHHNIPLSFSKEVEINPERDLTPLCSNCHRMIHRDLKNVMTIAELQEKYNKI